MANVPSDRGATDQTRQRRALQRTPPGSAVLPVQASDPTTNGQLVYNSTTNQPRIQVAGVLATLPVVYSVLGSTKTVTNPPSTATDFNAATTILPANFLTAGRVLRFTYGGTFVMGATSVCDVWTFWNGLAGFNISETGINDGTAVTSGLTVNWEVELLYTQQTVGTSGQWAYILNLSNTARSSQFITNQLVLQAGGGPGFIVDTTVTNQFGVGASFATANAGNQATLSTLIAEILN